MLIWFAPVAISILGAAIQGDESPAPFRAARARAHVEFLASDALQGREPGTPGGHAAAEYLAKQYATLKLEPLGDQGTFFQAFAIDGGVNARNVVGLLPGAGDLADQFIIVAAHHDHIGKLSPEHASGMDVICNGADDNASGVAALLQIAEWLSSERDRLPASRRGVIFLCTDGEERGLFGASHYADHPARPLEKTVAFVNFDMVGHLDRAKLYANDAESCLALAEILRDLGTRSGLPVETRIGGGNRSDQLVFLERRIPSMHFLTGIHREYHLPTDETGTVDFEGLARIAWLGGRFVETLLDLPGPFAFRPIAPIFDVQHALGIVRRIGMIPNVGSQDGRYVQVALVVPGSPAAKAGLRAGDQIVAMNGLGFRRIEDAMIIFSQLHFENGLKLTARRGQTSVDVLLPAEVFKDLAGPDVRAVGEAYEVTFTFQAQAGTDSVCLAGTFNDWNPAALRMDGPDARGLCSAKLTLSKGVYEYKFVVNGTEWQSDPRNLHQAGLYHNSVVWVGTTSSGE